MNESNLLNGVFRKGALCLVAALIVTVVSFIYLNANGYSLVATIIVPLVLGGIVFGVSWFLAVMVIIDGM